MTISNTKAISVLSAMQSIDIVDTEAYDLANKAVKEKEKLQKTTEAIKNNIFLNITTGTPASNL